MKFRHRRTSIHLLTLAAALIAVPSLHAMEVVYDGSLEDYGVAANGRYDFQVSAFDAPTAGRALGAPMTFEQVVVKDGSFRVEFDAGTQPAERLWVGLAVRVAGTDGAFAAIPGRSQAAEAKLVGSCWSTTGDAGTTSRNFLGTTDAMPLNFKVQDRAVASYIPSALQVNGGPATASIVAGSYVNEVSSALKGAVIAGGGAPAGSDPDYLFENLNKIWGDYGVIGGGAANVAGRQAVLAKDIAFAVVSGGSRNIANDTGSTVGGGERNTAYARHSVVAGGYGNTARGTATTVAGGGAGGDPNDAVGAFSTVGGGAANTTGGEFSTISGGLGNCAGGDYSWAGGMYAKVRKSSDLGTFDGSCSATASSGDADGDNGTFIWADDQETNFVSTGPRQFLVRAQGGVGINTSNPLLNALRVNGTVRLDTLSIGGTTSLCRNSSNQISSCSSSARYKEDITDLGLGLASVEQLRPVGYRWKETHQADVGFVAEEVAALDERLVTRNDEGQIEGVKYDRLSALLAGAVQELSARERLHAQELEQLRVRLARLESGSRRD